MQSSSIRGKVAFVPWIAALVLGASAHVGWLVTELRTDPGARPSIIVIDAGNEGQGQTHAEPCLHDRVAHHERALRQRARRRARDTRPGIKPRPSFEAFDPPSSLGDWVRRHTTTQFTIDRQALEHIVPPALLTIDRGALETLAASVGPREAIQLHNIRSDSPLWTLGLRNGDRVVGLHTEGDGHVEQIRLEVERRGQVLDLRYELL